MYVTHCRTWKAWHQAVHPGGLTRQDLWCCAPRSRDRRFAGSLAECLQSLGCLLPADAPSACTSVPSAAWTPQAQACILVCKRSGCKGLLLVVRYTLATFKGHAYYVTASKSVREPYETYVQGAVDAHGIQGYKTWGLPLSTWCDSISTDKDGVGPATQDHKLDVHRRTDCVAYEQGCWTYKAQVPGFGATQLTLQAPSLISLVTPCAKSRAYPSPRLTSLQD